MKTLYKTSALLVGLLSAQGAVHAESLEEHGPLYFNLGAGVSKLEPEIGANSDAKVTENQGQGFRVGAGYKFTPKWAMELQYADLGESEVTASSGTKVNVPYQFAGLGAVYSPFAKETLGGFNWLLEAGVGKLMNDEEDNVHIEEIKGAQVFLGTGLEYAFNHSVAVRLMVESYDKDAALATLGVSYAPHTAEPPPVVVPEPVVVVQAPEPMPNPDLDGDGVTNDKDCCPNTAAGLEVNGYGCPVLNQRLQNITFEYNSARLTMDSELVLNSMVEALKSYNTASVELGAHTDSVGSDRYNQKLSQQRAQSTMNYLVSQGINPSRLTARGYGELNPIASNDTKEGRAQNRRVEIRVTDPGQGAQNCKK